MVVVESCKGLVELIVVVGSAEKVKVICKYTVSIRVILENKFWRKQVEKVKIIGQLLGVAQAQVDFAYFVFL